MNNGEESDVLSEEGEEKERLLKPPFDDRMVSKL